MKTGAFIVIDGGKAVGKSTQLQLLIERLVKSNIPHHTMKFPQPGASSAKIAERYLKGKYGPAASIHPDLASLAFAVDRADASAEINSRLDKGEAVIADRYVASNLAFQGSKFSDPKERDAFIEDQLYLEYGSLKIAKPQLNIILELPAEIAAERLAARGSGNDVHTANLDQFRAVAEAYTVVAKLGTEYRTVQCVENGKERTKEEIHEAIWQLVEPFLPTRGN